MKSLYSVIITCILCVWMCIHVSMWLSIFNEVTVFCDYNLLPLCLDVYTCTYTIFNEVTVLCDYNLHPLCLDVYTCTYMVVYI